MITGFKYPIGCQGGGSNVVELFCLVSKGAARSNGWKSQGDGFSDRRDRSQAKLSDDGELRKSSNSSWTASFGRSAAQGM